jgi:hypothetical protein
LCRESLAQVSGACPACLRRRNKPKKYGQRQICAGIDKDLAFQALAPFGKVVHLSGKRQKTPNFARVRIKGIKAAKLTKIGKF